MGCGRLVGSERTVGVGGLMGGELFFFAKKTDMYMYKKEWEVDGGWEMCGSGRLLEGERFICKIYGKKYIYRWAVQALHLQGG